RQPGVGPAQLRRQVRAPLRESLDVRLVDDGLRPRPLRRAIALPVEALVDDHGFRNRRDVVLVVELEVDVVARPLRVRDIGQDVRSAEVDRPLDRLRIGIDHQLERVEAQAALGVVGPVDAIAVALPGADARQVAVPVVRRVVRLLDALLVVAVEEAQLHALGVLAEQREVRPLAVPGRAERERPARPQLTAQRTSAPVIAPSRTPPSCTFAVPVVRTTRRPRAGTTWARPKFISSSNGPRRTRSHFAASSNASTWA